jgi:hypothetical protein
MKLLGFNLTKIQAERYPKQGNDIKIETNIDISDLSGVKSDMLKKEELLGVKFEYTIKYSIDFAIISFGGNLLFSGDSKEVSEILDSWKNKQIPEKFKEFLFNIILKKSSLRALQLEDELNLPSHIPMPSLNFEKK